MHVLFTKQFNEDLSQLRDKKLARRIEIIVEDVIHTGNISEIPNLKKLTGFRNAYRIRVGDYRIGILLENNRIVFATFQHRKEIYKNFP